MIISDEAALVILAMFAVVGLVLLAVFVLGVRSFLRGRRVLGVLLMLVPLGLVFGPAAVDGVRNARLRPVIDAANHYPEALDLRGQRVLFVADSSTICDGLCGEMVSYGVPAEVYWVGLRSSYDGIPGPGVIAATISPPDEVQRVTLGPAIPDLGNLRFPEGRPAGDLPPFDLVIFEDNGTLRSIAPDLLGLPDALVPDAQIATLVFTDWPDPFTTPPSEPTYRMVAPWLPARDAFFWPLSTSYDAYPPLAEWNQRWRELFCTQSDGSVPRDDVFYSSACAQ